MALSWRPLSGAPSDGWLSWTSKPCQHSPQESASDLRGSEDFVKRLSALSVEECQ
ncbi:hypothetical protein HMPREF9946_00278 [Acetobacteraceae bacterium AT-5844]|nr:hypothetical protein HMPREF9946_00278 [Acetobacteraceae bacterium AT-5844]